MIPYGMLLDGSVYLKKTHNKKKHQTSNYSYIDYSVASQQWLPVYWRHSFHAYLEYIVNFHEINYWFVLSLKDKLWLVWSVQICLVIVYLERQLVLHQRWNHKVKVRGKQIFQQCIKNLNRKEYSNDKYYIYWTLTFAMCSTMGATSRAGTAHNSGIVKFTAWFGGDMYCSSWFLCLFMLMMVYVCIFFQSLVFISTL